MIVMMDCDVCECVWVHCGGGSEFSGHTRTHCLAHSLLHQTLDCAKLEIF